MDENTEKLEAIKLEFISSLDRLRNYQRFIPHEMSNLPVRKAFWQSLRLNLQQLQESGLLTPEMREKVRIFIEYVKNEVHPAMFMFEEEHMAKANALLDELLEYLR